MATTLVTIAKYHVRASQDDLRELLRLKAKLKFNRPGLTDKNKARLGQFDDPRNVERLLSLPRLLVDRAVRSKRESSQIALDVMHAVAIEILLACLPPTPCA